MRVSLLPDVGSALPTACDVAAVVCAAPAYEVWNGALDVVGLRVGQFFLPYDECGDDGFSPVVHVRGSLVCHVDLDSLWMVHWEYLSGGECYVVLLVCLICRSFRIRPV